MRFSDLVIRHSYDCEIHKGLSTNLFFHGIDKEPHDEGGPGLAQGVGHHEVDGLGRGSPGWSHYVAEIV